MGELLAFIVAAGLIAVLVEALWLPVLLVLGAVALGYAGSWYNDRLTSRWEAEQARMAALVKRADSEHAAMMRGDDYAGTYGQYPPTLADR